MAKSFQTFLDVKLDLKEGKNEICLLQVSVNLEKGNKLSEFQMFLISI